MKIYKNFKEHKALSPGYQAQAIFGGPLLGVRSDDFIDFFDWEDFTLIRRIGKCRKQLLLRFHCRFVLAVCGCAVFVFNGPLFVDVIVLLRLHAMSVRALFRCFVVSVVILLC